MTMHRITTATLAAALALPLAGLAPTAAHADGGFTEVAISIPASMPDDNGKPVVLDGGVDIPNSGCPCPMILINHGFLGNWHNSNDVASAFANNGYVVLRYSSRGFGATTGEVDLVGPKETTDMADAITYVQDNVGNVPELAGKVIHNDVGQYGGSYGGGHAWAAVMSTNPVLQAAIKTSIPTATWSDFYQALLPNDVMLAAYANGFYATGYDPTASVVNNATSGHPQPAVPDTTQNYSTELHRWMAEANSGVNIPDIRAGLDSRSVMNHLADVHAPVFIIQGSNDGLFTENQALSAYQALKAQGIPARLYIGGIGHPPSDGATDHPEALHVGAEMLAWFDHYLKGVNNGIDRMPPIEFSHATYFNNHWDGTTRSAYAFPAGPASDLFLCTTGANGGALSTTACPSANPAVAVNLPGAGGGYDEEPVTSDAIKDGIHELTCQDNEPICQQRDPDLSTYPAVLKYDAAPVPADTEWFGPPHLDLQAGSVDVLPAGADGTVAAFQLDPKFYDVAPDGSATLITRGAYAEPLAAAAPSQQTIPSHPVGYDAFGLSYVLPAGHHLRLTLSTSDVPYLRPTVNPFAVALFAGSKLAMPTAANTFPTPPIGSPGPTLPEAPWPILLAVTAGVIVTAAYAIRRRSATAA
jgi:ABC-2 type transport system ATP-binding protein